MSTPAIPGPPRTAVRQEPNLAQLEERQLRLISLLLAGHTDASAARRLGVSPRTVTNIVRSLMDHLQVDTRFQLGVALGRNADLERDFALRDAPADGSKLERPTAVPPPARVLRIATR